MSKPMKLELYFAADPSFRRSWEHAVSSAADDVLAQQCARELAGEPKALQITMADLEVWEEPLPSLGIQAAFPWPPSVVAGHDTIIATFQFYLAAEVQHRLDQRAAQD